MKKYSAFAASVIDHDDDRFVFESLYEHVVGMFDDGDPPPQEVEGRIDIPPSAKVGLYLWQFAMDASSGIPNYLLNHCPSVEKMKLTRRALQTVGAVELVALLDSAIPIVNEMAKPFGEFRIMPEDPWFDQFPINPQWMDLEKISQASLDLLDAPLMHLAASYLRSSREELCRA